VAARRRLAGGPGQSSTRRYSDNYLKYWLNFASRSLRRVTSLCPPGIVPDRGRSRPPVPSPKSTGSSDFWRRGVARASRCGPARHFDWPWHRGGTADHTTSCPSPCSRSSRGSAPLLPGVASGSAPAVPEPRGSRTTKTVVALALARALVLAAEAGRWALAPTGDEATCVRRIPTRSGRTRVSRSRGKADAEQPSRLFHPQRCSRRCRSGAIQPIRSRGKARAHLEPYKAGKSLHADEVVSGWWTRALSGRLERRGRSFGTSGRLRCFVFPPNPPLPWDGFRARARLCERERA
jgi:hypothetical protein